jgi:hypothetical protein
MSKGGNGKSSKGLILPRGGDKVIVPEYGKVLGSSCCDAPMLILSKLTNEAEVICSKCRGYIGDLAPKSYACFYFGIPHTIRDEVKKLEFEGEIPLEEFQRIEVAYRLTLADFANKTLREIVGKYTRGEDYNYVRAEDERMDDDEGGSGTPEHGTQDGREDDS